MMQKEILLADGIKHIAMNGKLGAFFRLWHLQLQAMKAGKGPEPQVFMVLDGSGQFFQKGQVDGAVDAVNHGLWHLQGLDQMVGKFLIHVAFHFKPHDGAVLPLPQLGLYRSQKVRSILLRYVKIHITDNSVGAGVIYLVAMKETGEEFPDNVLQKDEIIWGIREPQESGEKFWNPKCGKS